MTPGFWRSPLPRNRRSRWHGNQRVDFWHRYAQIEYVDDHGGKNVQSSSTSVVLHLSHQRLHTRCHLSFQAWTTAAHLASTLPESSLAAETWPSLSLQPSYPVVLPPHSKCWWSSQQKHSFHELTMPDFTPCPLESSPVWNDHHHLLLLISVSAWNLTSVRLFSLSTLDLNLCF